MRTLKLCDGDVEDVTLPPSARDVRQIGKLGAPAKVKGGRGWESSNEAHASTERSYTAAASAVRVSAARHWNGSAFPSLARPPSPPACARSATRRTAAALTVGLEVYSLSGEPTIYIKRHYVTHGRRIKVRCSDIFIGRRAASPRRPPRRPLWVF